MDDFQFEERAEHETGFAAIYRAEIAPYLRAAESARQIAVRRSQFRVAVALVLGLVLATLAFSVDPLLPIFPVAVGGGVALYFYLSRTDHLRDQLTAHIRPILCRFMGLEYTEEPTRQAISLGRLIGLNIVPSADKTYLGPMVTGRWRGLEYRLVNASFYDESRDSDGDRKRTRLFSGILLEVECVNSMPRVVFLPDFGRWGNALFQWASRSVRPPHRLALFGPETEEFFEVFTDDPDAAAKHLYPAFGRQLVDIAKRYQGGQAYAAAAFDGKAFYLALSLPHAFLSFDVLDRPLQEADEQIRNGLSDLMIPRQIIDTLLDGENA